MLSSYLVRTSYHASATPEISTLSLHDALPISNLLRTRRRAQRRRDSQHCPQVRNQRHSWVTLLLQSERILRFPRSEEHTSELQSRLHLVCRLLLEKKKKVNADTRV